MRKQICGSCEYNGDTIKLSFPPQVQCELTGKFHFLTEECELEASKEYAEVRHGRWLTVSRKSEYLDMCFPAVKCSACGYIKASIPMVCPNYCEECGAKMEGVDEGEIQV